MLTHTILADFVVWDNDGVYLLVTVASLAFTAVLIVMVMQKSRTGDRRLQERRAAAKLVAQSASETSDETALAAPLESPSGN